MKKTNLPLICMAIYITALVVSAAYYVGTPPHMTTSVEWYFPITVFIIFFLPFILGWDAHKEAHKDRKEK